MTSSRKKMWNKECKREMKLAKTVRQSLRCATTKDYPPLNIKIILLKK